jgi:TrmH family RNA methyltransferase
MAEGWKALKDALNSGSQILFVTMTPKHLSNPDYRSIINEIESRSIALKEIDERELRQVCDTVQAQGVVALMRQRSYELDRKHLEHASLLVFADRIADPGNLGSIVRTSDWFAADCLILSEGCVELHNEKVVRSTSGSIFHVPIIEHADTPTTLSWLKEVGFKVVVTSADGKISYARAEYGAKNVIVLGSEASGISPSVRAHADVVVKIPLNGKAESLNVGVAFGIVLAHLRNEG